VRDRPGKRSPALSLVVAHPRIRAPVVGHAAAPRPTARSTTARRMKIEQPTDSYRSRQKPLVPSSRQPQTYSTADFRLSPNNVSNRFPPHDEMVFGAPPVRPSYRDHSPSGINRDNLPPGREQSPHPAGDRKQPSQSSDAEGDRQPSPGDNSRFPRNNRYSRLSLRIDRAPGRRPKTPCRDWQQPHPDAARQQPHRAAAQHRRHPGRDMATTEPGRRVASVARVLRRSRVNRRNRPAAPVGRATTPSGARHRE